MQRLEGLVLLLVLGLHLKSFANEPEAVPGQYVVTLKQKINDHDLKIMNSQMGEVISVIESANAVVIQRTVGEKTSAVTKLLASDSAISIAEPNYIYRTFAVPNDPQLNQLWGLINNGQTDSQQTGVAGIDIGAEQAWDIETGSEEVVVAVIDTGIDPTHEDLKDNMWINEAEANGQPGVDDDNNGFIDDVHGYNFVGNSGDLIDDHGHGSHCAGTVGATGNDGKGIVGVAWNVRLMGLKFLSAQGGGSLEDAIRAIDYATQMGADIMSNSWGGGGFSQQLKDAIDRAEAQGILFVAAAGNSRMDNDARPSYPASYDSPNIISVAALNNRGQLASFSNYGATKVHVAAPGVNVVSSVPGGYDSYSGTSMACPHVSGIASLVLSKFPGMSYQEVKRRIVERARPLAALRGKVSSAGLANAYYALTDTEPPEDPNDPALWDNMFKSLSSPHPYVNNFNQEFDVSFPGAVKIAVYFEKFETEATFDRVQLIDKNGNVVATMSGNNNKTWSPVVAGDSMKIRFTSDRSVTGYGFDVTKIAFKMTE